jgi:SAM-dependent methyltransferase
MAPWLAMTDQESRYDRIAEGYARWWSPVHRPATLRLLDLVAGDAAPVEGSAPHPGSGRARRIVDIGCGTAAMAVEAAARWPDVVVDATDVSAGMLAVAGHTVDAAGAPGERVRLTQAAADRLPFPDGTFDVALAAFVLQLVPSRPRALREMRRVLRAGGRLAYVGWLAGDLPLAADAAWDAALDAAGLGGRESPGGHDDLASVAAAIGQLRAAGLSRVTAREDRLVHQFTAEAYAAFVTRFDDGDLVASLEPDVRAALEADLVARLRALPQAGLRLELPIVYATGVRGQGSAGNDDRAADP